ncbi:TauD/TfdA family dioxygenase [Streptomyces sp. NPDC048442]|uniref:TauD/TfdA family dioxygenase n=1 Tax=Streptomyces sp. NPDC048442 TaxID=3154823 RepID=UPI00341781C3
MHDLLHLDGHDMVHGPTSPREFASRLVHDGAGAALVSFAPEHHDRNLELSLGLLSALGPVLSVYPADGCWSDLEVRTGVDPGRTHGTGENQLHVDLVDRALPPRYIALYCVRDDPRGGGASALSDLRAASARLSRPDRNLLEQSLFSYWADEGVHGVGESLIRFPVLPEGEDAPIRFTSKMLPHLRHGTLLPVEADELVPRVCEAFSHLVDAAHELRSTVRLCPGQLLVFDQFRYAHGRMPLGSGQADVPVAQRRLLKQTYVGGTR